MKNVALGIFGSLLFLTSVPVAFAAVTVSPLGFYCDPYSANFIDGQFYAPNDQSNNCTFTTQNPGPMGYLVFRGTPTAGGATYLQYGLNDGASPYTLGNITFSTSGNPNQPGDPFFAISFQGDFNTVNAFYNYFQNGIGTLPEGYNLITWKWGTPPTPVADTVPPTINNMPANIVTTATGTLTPVSWSTPTATDNVDGTDPVDCAPHSGSSFPVGTTTVTCTAIDHANNQSSKSFTVTVTKENQSITPTTIPSTLYLGSTTTLTATSSSGLPVTYSASNCSVAGNILTFSNIGTCTIITQQAGDDLYNAAPSITQTINVGYRWDGFLQPINDTGHLSGSTYSVFKSGSTVPVKFQLKMADGTVVQASTLPQWLTPVQLGIMSSSTDGVTYTDTPSTGNTFSLNNGQYSYNWSTKGFTPGYWYQLMAKVDDGEVFWVVVGLR